MAKPHRKYSRWRVVGTYPTYREAAAMIGTVPDADDWITNRPEQQPDAPSPEK